METDINKTKSDEIEKWREDFWSRFVFEDTGPDGDWYGADLPTWNEDFEHTEKYSQIVNITDFIRKLLISTRSKTLQEVCEKIDIFNVHCANIKAQDKCSTCVVLADLKLL